MRSDCLVQFSILNPFTEPMNCVFDHESSTHEFGAMRSDCLVQFSILNPFSEPMNCVFVHVSSTFEFGAMRSYCLVQFSILNPFSEPHERYCLGLFVCPPLSSLDLCFMSA